MTAQIIDFLKYKKEREEKQDLWNPEAGIIWKPEDISTNFIPNYDESNIDAATLFLGSFLFSLSMESDETGQKEIIDQLDFSRMFDENGNPIISLNTSDEIKEE